MRGQRGAGEYRAEIEVAQSEQAADCGALRYLWARHCIAALEDCAEAGGEDRHRERIARLGLKYNLLTAHTSFVGVDRDARRQGGERMTTVRQPLPLPKGVDERAVGSGSSAGHVGAGANLGAAPTAAPAREWLETCEAEAAPTAAPAREWLEACEVEAAPFVESGNGEERETVSLPERGNGKGQLTMVEVEVEGGGRGEWIRLLLERHLAQLAAVLRDREVEMRFTIDARGSYADGEVVGAGLSAFLKRRIETVLARIQFPPPAAGREVEVRVRFRGE